MSIIINTTKNREREKFSFANINLLGACNVNCYFCLGKDIENLPCGMEYLRMHYSEWKEFGKFISRCKELEIKKIYITGQNTDALLYMYLGELIFYLQEQGFGVGIRTNGYGFKKDKLAIEVANRCDLSVGISIHTLDPMTSRMILGRSDIPDWQGIIPELNHPRVSIVLNRCNEHEFFSLLRNLSSYENIKYIQVRRVSTDTRYDQLAADMVAYERQYTKVRDIFPVNKKLWEDAEEFIIYGKPVVFWRTIKTSVNSVNYFVDGTYSEEYFVVEGYNKNR